MKQPKRLFALIIAIAIFTMSAPMSLAASQDDEISSKVLNEVTSLYTDVYTISDASAYVTDKSVNENGDVVYQIDVAFKRTLKAKNAKEIAAVKGFYAAMNELTDSKAISAAEKYIVTKEADLNGNYIGVAQDTNCTLFVTLPSERNSILDIDNAINTDSIVMESWAGDSVIPVTDIAPKGYSEKYRAGADLLTKVVSAAEKSAQTTLNKTNSTVIQNSALNTRFNNANINAPKISLLNYSYHNSRIQDYDRVDARDYAREWSCNTGAMYDHSSCHNSPTYQFIDENDCANFVSQCIAEGGLPTDSTWYNSSSSYAWMTCTYLRNYVTDNYLFFHSDNIYDAFAGSIVDHVNDNGSTGHVGIVDQNDWETMTLCAHTGCRSSYPISNWTYYDYDDGLNYWTEYYVPYWDSYANDWAA